MKRVFLLIILGFISHNAGAMTLWCEVEKKVTSDKEYTKEQISKENLGLYIRHLDGASPLISRCGGPTPCDDYQADHVEFTEGVGIIKYYYFRGQFDVQVFSNLKFVENNGRGSISWGQCYKQ